MKMEIMRPLLSRLVYTIQSLKVALLFRMLSLKCEFTCFQFDGVVIPWCPSNCLKDAAALLFLVVFL